MGLVLALAPPLARFVRSAAVGISAVFMVTLVRCSSTSGGSGVTGAAQDQADSGSVTYPSANIGTAQRGVDANGNPNKSPGDVIADFKFLGYPNANISNGLQTIALSDYDDPTASKYKVLHIIAA